MATLLLKLTGYFVLNRTIFPPKLFVYDDLLVYEQRHWFVVKEITISYNQISQVTLHTGIVFGHIKVSSTGVEDIHIKFLFKGPAAHAKRIIDQKVYHVHAKRESPKNKGVEKEVRLFEKSLHRLDELHKRNKISNREYKKKKKQLLKNLR